MNTPRSTETPPRNVHYSRAPITEAIIALHWQLQPKTSVADLLALREYFPDYQAKSEALHETTAQIAPNEGLRESSSHQVGYRFSAAGQQRILQVRLDAFIFSQLAPYDRWELIRDEAKRLWGVCAAHLRPAAIGRVGVRYINQIGVPLESGSVELDKYLSTAPRIAPALPQNMNYFFMRIQLPMENGMAIITETTLPSSDAEKVPVVLDIDAIVQDAMDEDSAWREIERLRHEKNRIFEACITDKVRELIR